MSNEHPNAGDPLGFVRNMWGNMGFSLPGMVAPTFDVEELDKRIKDLKAVEGWLRMNLSMLQMTIQGLEMQKTTISAVKTMGNMAASAAQQVAQDSLANRAAPPAPEAPQQAPTPTPEATAAAAAATAAAEAAGTLSQAAMWPWNLMQQMQETLQEQAAAAKKPAKAAAKKAAAKPADATPRRTPPKS